VAKRGSKQVVKEGKKTDDGNSLEKILNLEGDQPNNGSNFPHEDQWGGEGGSPCIKRPPIRKCWGGNRLEGNFISNSVGNTKIQEGGDQKGAAPYRLNASRGRGMGKGKKPE